MGIFVAGLSWHAAMLLQADIVILTSDNPRRELPQDIINGIISGYPEDMRELNANCDIDGGFLQDQGWVDETEREFVWYWGERYSHPQKPPWKIQPAPSDC